MFQGRLLYRAAISLSVVCFIVLSVFLYGCTRVIRDASDELVMHSWSVALDGGAEVSLLFDGDNAEFSVTSGDTSSVIKGYCVLSADRFMIIDDETGEQFVFDYILHGDRIELTHNNSLIILEKG
ncbi:MAG: hypothetical protein IJH32_02030 [Ruminococcus sp.]|nr:hypothetical protein [Ruminococcus sp.]